MLQHLMQGIQPYLPYRRRKESSSDSAVPDALITKVRSGMALPELGPLSCYIKTRKRLALTLPSAGHGIARNLRNVSCKCQEPFVPFVLVLVFLMLFFFFRISVVF